MAVVETAGGGGGAVVKSSPIKSASIANPTGTHAYSDYGRVGVICMHSTLFCLVCGGGWR